MNCSTGRHVQSKLQVASGRRGASQGVAGCRGVSQGVPGGITYKLDEPFSTGELLPHRERLQAWTIAQEAPIQSRLLSLAIRQYFKDCIPSEWVTVVPGATERGAHAGAEGLSTARTALLDCVKRTCLARCSARRRRRIFESVKDKGPSFKASLSLAC